MGLPRSIEEGEIGIRKSILTSSLSKFIRTSSPTPASPLTSNLLSPFRCVLRYRCNACVTLKTLDHLFLFVFIWPTK